MRRYHASTDGGATAFREALSESMADFWYIRCLLRPKLFDMGRARRPNSQIGKTGPYASAPEFWPAPPYGPSRYFRARQYLGDFGRRRGPPDEELQTVFCERVSRVDHTGAAARRMRNAGEKWSANVTNEENKIAAIALAPAGEKAEIANIVRGIRDRRRATSRPFAPVVYARKNCCSKDELRFWRENWGDG